MQTMLKSGKRFCKVCWLDKINSKANNLDCPKNDSHAEMANDVDIENVDKCDGNNLSNKSSTCANETPDKPPRYATICK